MYCFRAVTEKFWFSRTIYQINSIYTKARGVPTAFTGVWSLTNVRAPPCKNWNNILDIISFRHLLHDSCGAVYLKKPSFPTQPL